MISLLGEGHELVEASSGAQALGLMEAGRYDLVLLDLLMPGMSGIEVLAELRSRGDATPVVVLTADIQNSTRERVQALGAAAMINKPIRKDALVAAMASSLRTRDDAPPVTLKHDVKDAFEEMMNIAMGRAADVLNTMLNSHVVLSVPAVETIPASELPTRLARNMGGSKLAGIEMSCTGELSAAIELVFSLDDAGKLADCIHGLPADAAVDRDSMRAGTLCELGNIVMNAIFGTMSNALGIDLSFTVPSYLEGESSAIVGEISLGAHGVVLLIRTRFEIADLSIYGDIILFLSLRSFEDFTRMMQGNPAATP